MTVIYLVVHHCPSSNVSKLINNDIRIFELHSHFVHQFQFSITVDGIILLQCCQQYYLNTLTLILSTRSKLELKPIYQNRHRGQVSYFHDGVNGLGLTGEQLLNYFYWKTVLISFRFIKQPRSFNIL